MACPFISDFTIGLRPSPTTPQLKQTSMNPAIHCLMKLAKTSKQSSKIQQWQAKDKRKMALVVSEQECKKWKQKCKNGDLGLLDS